MICNPAGQMTNSRAQDIERWDFEDQSKIFFLNENMLCHLIRTVSRDSSKESHKLCLYIEVDNHL